MANPNWVKGKSASPETMFRPGQRPGPGRPKKLPITTAMENILEENIGKQKTTRLKLGGARKYADAIAMAAMNRALRGDLAAIKLIMEHVEGKPLERRRLSGEEEQQSLKFASSEGMSREQLIEILKNLFERARAREATYLETDSE